jgi:ZIP family zinc transporter
VSDANELIEAFAVGTAAQASLLLAGLVACWVTVPRKLIGIMAGFGAGAMLAAISFDLVPEASELALVEIGFWMLGGVGLFIVGDHLVERRFGDDGEGKALGIVVGSVVDGVPESSILGIQLATGIPISASFIFAVLISNIPQAIAPSAELAADGWTASRLGRLWLMVVIACGAAAAAGYALADQSSAVNGQGLAALAAGGLLAMLTNSLMPFAYDHAGEWAGVATVVGFCVSLSTS